MSNSQEKSNNNKISQEWDPDEIPGYTTFLYKQNRFREPHEYVGYWKVEAKIAQIKAKLGIPQKADTPEILAQLEKERQIAQEVTESRQLEFEELELTKERLQSRINDLKKDIEETKTAMQVKTTEVAEVKATLNSVSYRTQQQIDGLTFQNKVLSDALSMYGEHTHECTFVELLESGKLTDESVSCNCGWYKLKISEEL